MKFKNKILIVLLVFFVHILITIYLYNNDKTFIYCPGENCQVTGISDSSQNGKSSVQIDKIDKNRIVYSYNLINSSTFPYCGINMSNNNSTDLSPYCAIKLKIATKETKILKVNLKMGMSLYENLVSVLYLDNLFLVRQEKKEYILHLNKFKVGLLWSKKKDLSDKVPDLIKKNKLFAIELIDILRDQKQRSGTLTVEEVSFIVDRKKTLYYSLVIFAFYVFSILLYVVYYFNEKNTVNNIEQAVIPYKRLQVDDVEDFDTETLLAYLQNNFQKQDMSISKASMETGIAKPKISKIIKSTISLTFPQYIHSLRFAESRKLLETTDMKVIDIGYQVGYKNLNNFNKMFKSISKVTPTEYRKQTLE